MNKVNAHAGKEQQDRQKDHLSLINGELEGRFNTDVGLASFAENLEWEMFDIRLCLCMIVLT